MIDFPRFKGWGVAFIRLAVPVEQIFKMAFA